MLNSMYIAATGLRSSSIALDTISENVSNLNTVAFKKEKASFQDLMYQDIDSQLSVSEAGNAISTIGAGSALTSLDKDFTNGELKATQGPLDIAINGRGLIEVMLPNGEYGYTRTGSLKINDEGYLTSNNGLVLSSMIQIPADATQIKISEDGKVTTLTKENDIVEIGTIKLATFPNESGLKAIGNGIYTSQVSAGTISYSSPGDNGGGTIKQGFLEASNVSLVAELMDMVVAQQAFTLNSQIIKASNQMQETINNLRQA